ncbi:MAG TPA: DsbE family thiol:disulfide interchange protein [Pyrinomonadaceae bacterium]|jgi:cytochrome c biogenesis protein CcmG/thiol:disulfide interchange protein DsbE|nr:DsbE family thiol:disulfide interchange protein [Pyrinomonadaceae bacterium]
MLRYLIPLGIFLVLVAFLAIGLRLGDPHELPSALVDKPAPAFRLPQLKAPEKAFSNEDVRGKVWLLNVWASWCIECRNEHPYLFEYAKSGVVPIYGLNYKDNREDALAWLGDLGDPYVLSAVDLDGRVAIDYGVYGAPETYVIDQSGTIRHKHVGPMMPDVWSKEILPLVQELNRQGTSK